MISAGETLFGSAPESPQPFRGPGWENQGDILNSYMMGQFMTPEMLDSQNQRVAQLQQQWQASGGGQEQTPTFQFPGVMGAGGGMIGGGGMTRDPRTGQIIQGGYQTTLSGGDDQLRQQLEAAQRTQGIMQSSQPYWNQNRFTAGQQLEGQLQPTIATAGGLLGQQNQLAQLQQQMTQKQYTPEQRAAFSTQAGNLQNLIAQGQANLAETTPQYAARNPYQFQGSQYTDPTNGMTAQQMVGDAFTPQMAMANREAERTGGLQREQIMADMNRRGMLTSGATTRAMQMQQRDQGDRLANLSNQFGAQQAQQQLGANQYLQGMGWQQQQAQQNANWQKQTAQAEEIFRQQGATDAQASQMANMALQRQQANYQQGLTGRQQGVNEWSLQTQANRQPMEDLFRLYQLSTGGSPGSPGSPGLLGSLIPAGATLGAAALMCLPAGTPIEMSDGGTFPVDIIEPGDEVKGGVVLQVSQSMRPRGHTFFRHVFKSGKEVVMSDGHPFHDELDWKEPSNEQSQFTHDIRTSEGFYYVNGVKLGSTLG